MLSHERQCRLPVNCLEFLSRPAVAHFTTLYFTSDLALSGIMRRWNVVQGLAESYSNPEELAKEAYDLYADFRPQIQTGQSGWGQKGLLDLQHIRELHKK